MDRRQYSKDLTQNRVNIKVKLSGTATGTDDCIGYKAGIPELNRTLYLEYRNFSTDGSKYDKSEKQLTNSETSNIKSGLVCYLAKSDIRFPSNLNGKTGKLGTGSYGRYTIH